MCRWRVAREQCTRVSWNPRVSKGGPRRDPATMYAGFVGFPRSKGGGPRRDPATMYAGFVGFPRFKGGVPGGTQLQCTRVSWDSRVSKGGSPAGPSYNVRGPWDSRVSKGGSPAGPSYNVRGFRGSPS
eukprot:gene14142-biopygen11132